MDEKLLLMDEQRKWILEIETTPGGDAMETVEKTTKDLEYCINLVDEAVAGFERTNCDFERSSAVGKMLPQGITNYREIVCERVN